MGDMSQLSFPEQGDKSGHTFRHNTNSALQLGPSPATSPRQSVELVVDRHTSDTCDDGHDDGGNNNTVKADRHLSSTTSGRSSMPSLHTPSSDNSQLRLIPSSLGPSQSNNTTPRASRLSRQHGEQPALHADMPPQSSLPSPTDPQGEKLNRGGITESNGPNVVRARCSTDLNNVDCSFRCPGLVMTTLKIQRIGPTQRSGG
jgi:hypothetical protein